MRNFTKSIVLAVVFGCCLSALRAQAEEPQWSFTRTRSVHPHRSHTVFRYRHYARNPHYLPCLQYDTV